jgi:hypothetical protein
MLFFVPVAVLLAVGALVLPSFLEGADAAPPPPDAPGKYFGASSCAGSGCHSAPAPRAEPPYLQEYTTWSAQNPETGLPQDRHAYAFNRLYEESSTAIMEKLNGLEGTKDTADQSDRCLTCHGVSVHDYGTGKGGLPIAKHKELIGGKFAPEDGVSCDGCHGPYEKYGPLHNQKDWAPTQWKKMGSLKLYNELGIYYSKDLELWAGQCVRCHLAIDTNLIDAGHPDLVPFELYGQSQAVPPHWRDYATAAPKGAELPAPGPFHGVRVWGTGQAAALRSAALQLAARARGEKRNRATREHLEVAFERLAGHHHVLRHALERSLPDAAKEVHARMDELAKLFARGAASTGSVRVAGLADIVKDLDAQAQALRTLDADGSPDGETAAKALEGAAALLAGDVETLKKLAALARAPAPASGGDLDVKRIADVATALATVAVPLDRKLADMPVDASLAKALLRAIADDPGASRTRRTREQTGLGLYALYASYSHQVPAPEPDPVMEAIYALFESFADDKRADFERNLEIIRKGLK